MARGRMLNKKISNSKQVNDLPETAQLLFTWLIPQLDCNGCFYGSAEMIKSLVFPRKNYSKKIIEQWLLAMENSRGTDKSALIVRYFVAGEQYLYMPGFADEQVGLRRDKEKGEFPTFDGRLTESVGQTIPLSRREVEVEREGEVNEKITPLPPSPKNASSSSSGKKDEDDVFKILEQEHIPAMREDVELAVKRFTGNWVHDAIKVAVKSGVLQWRYVAKVLLNWKKEGRSVEGLGPPIRFLPEKYTNGKLGHLVQR